MALSMKNKLQFVDGTLPHSSTLNESEFRAWKSCNDTISSWIVNTVSKDIATSIIYINNCQDMWLSLKERFSQKNGPQAFQLQKAISSLSQDSILKSVQTFFDQQYVFQFLMGLNESFAHIRGQILLMDPLPPINKVFSLVVQEESQRQIFIGSMTSNPADLITKSVPTQQNRFPKQMTRRDKPVCTHCGISGHTIDKCYKLHGFPPGFKFTKRPYFSPSSSVNYAAQTHGKHFSATPQVPQLPITVEQCQRLLEFL
ncbi:uncharacterized protein LOC132178232 [Corylus avellana]|uniref:uncharacterized protein LOC132178232 n=1 Tax=Corylus avellana TaxID=13451 RepID=UPI00286CC463|nr:uncharacterized protein LOC132178232 [Corylus avellana]